MTDLCRVILPPQSGRGFAPTRGTVVVTPNGERIPGVTKIVLVADLNSIWRAELHLQMQAPDISCLSTLHYTIHRAPWWQRLRNFLYWGFWRGEPQPYLGEIELKPYVDSNGDPV